MNDRYVRISTPILLPLEPVLQSWATCTQQYIDVCNGGDLPYWYNEQANVSILAGAAWKADWTAIEEYQISKVATEADERSTLIGRNDLYIANHDHEFCIEAKVAYANINFLERAEKHIKAKCAEATLDASRLDYKAPRLGAVFVAPYSTDIVATDAQIQSFQAMLLKFGAQALAWVKPDKAQVTMSHDKRFYPMVALLLMPVPPTS